MKKICIATLVALMSVPALAADVGVSISVGQPNFYGRIDIGGAPQPRVIYPAPVVIERSHDVVREPVYLRVPPGHSRHWRDHCHEYRACDRPVYFVHDDWYRRVYTPHYRDHRDEYRGDDREFHREERHERDRRYEEDRRERHERHERYERRRGD